MELELIDEEYLGIKFQFNQSLVNEIRALTNRRWNPEVKRWEVHIGHLPEIMKIFYLHPDKIDKKILEVYRKKWINTSLLVKVNNIYTVLSGASIPIDKIDEVTSFWVSGSEYNPKYVEGVWDGKRHLFDKRTYRFPTGLLNRVLSILDQENIKYQIVQEATEPPPTLKLPVPKVQLRPYQKEVVEKACEARRGVIEMAAGSGKTVVAAHIISRLKRPTAFFVHTRDLLYQTKNYFEEVFCQKVGQIGDGVIDIRPITVAMVQTTIRALGGDYRKFDEEDEDDIVFTIKEEQKEAIINLVNNYPVVFFDECHHLPSDTFYTIAMSTYNAGFRFGLSATPYRADRHDLLIEAALGKKIIKVNASKLIEEGYLVPAKIIFHPVPASKQSSLKDYNEIYQKEIVNSSFRNQLVAKYAKALAKEGKTVLILVQQVKHGENLLKLIEGAEFMQGADSSARRTAILNDFQKKKIKILIATTLADEGLDVPTLGALILAGGGKSETRALQRVGRCLRPSKDKKEAIIIDFMDSAPYLSEHSKRRWEIFSTEPKFKLKLQGELGEEITKI